MCPDQIQLSAFLDSELKLSENRKIEEHLKVCTDCQQVVTGFRSISHALVSEEVPLHEESLDHLYRTVRSRLFCQNDRTVWSRRVTVPLPLAAVAAIVFIAGSGFFGISVANRINNNLPNGTSSAVLTESEQKILQNNWEQDVPFNEVEISLPLDVEPVKSSDSQLVKMVSY